VLLAYKGAGASRISNGRVLGADPAAAVSIGDVDDGSCESLWAIKDGVGGRGSAFNMDVGLEGFEGGCKPYSLKPPLLAPPLCPDPMAAIFRLE
jgi:hypothetical protein